MRWSKRELWVLLALLVGAAGLRLLPWREMAAGSSLFIFPDDPPYHLRRALMTLAEWPRVPLRDPFLGFPEGAAVYWPPGLAWVLAALARLAGGGPGDRQTVEWIAALIPPLLGAITVAVTYVMTRKVFGRQLALLSAALLAVLPTHVEYTIFGRFDHHMLEPLLMLLLVLWVGRASSASSVRAWSLSVFAGAISMGAALLLWPGVLLHLGLLTVGLTLAVVLLDRTGAPGPGAALARASAAVLGLSLLTSLPAVLWSPWATQPAFYAPSPLHLAILASAALLFLVLGGFPPPLARWAPLWRLPVAVAAPTLLLLGISPLRRALFAGAHYTFGSSLAEASAESGSPFRHPTELLGQSVWPCLLLATIGAALWPILAARRRRADADRVPPLAGAGDPERPTELALAGAGLALLPAAALAVRWVVAWCPFAALAIAGLWRHALAPLGQRLAPGRPARWAALAGIALAGLATPLVLRDLEGGVVAPMQRAAQQLFQDLRRLSPPATDDELSSSLSPRYGVLSPWSLGHLLTYASGRPALGNNFFGFPSSDAANQRALRLYLEDCDLAARGMDHDRLRYVITTPTPPQGLPLMARVAGLDARAFVGWPERTPPAVARALITRLGAADGASIAAPRSDGQVEVLPACGRFRLVAEGAPGRRAASRGEAIRLFELVPGAVILTWSAPRSPIRASLDLATRGGRMVRWMTQVTAGADGRVAIVVPYATVEGCAGQRETCGVWPTRPHYLVQSADGRVTRVQVPQGAVERGLKLEATLSSSAAR